MVVLFLGIILLAEHALELQWSDINTKQYYVNGTL